MSAVVQVAGNQGRIFLHVSGMPGASQITGENSLCGRCVYLESRVRELETEQSKFELFRLTDQSLLENSYKKISKVTSALESEKKRSRELFLDNEKVLKEKNAFVVLLDQQTATIADQVRQINTHAQEVVKIQEQLVFTRSQLFEKMNEIATLKKDKRINFVETEKREAARKAQLEKEALEEQIRQIEASRTALTLAKKHSEGEVIRLNAKLKTNESSARNLTEMVNTLSAQCESLHQKFLESERGNKWFADRCQLLTGQLKVTEEQRAIAEEQSAIAHKKCQLLEQQLKTTEEQRERLERVAAIAHEHAQDMNRKIALSQLKQRFPDGFK